MAKRERIISIGLLVAGAVGIVMWLMSYITGQASSDYIRAYWVCFVLGAIGLIWVVVDRCSIDP